MMIKYFLICITIFSNLIFAQRGNLESFREFKWGTPIDTVRKLEVTQLMQSSSFMKTSSLTYSHKLLNESVQIDFIFENGLLVNGSYDIEATGSFNELFKKFRNYLITKYAKPNSWAVAQINSVKQWIKENDVGLYRGPELYWYFERGFIALLASKFEDEITIKILYVGDKTIEQYAKELALPIDGFFVEFTE